MGYQGGLGHRVPHQESPEKLTGDVFIDPGVGSVTAGILVGVHPTEPFSRVVLDEYYHDADRVGRLADIIHWNRMQAKWNIRRGFIDPDGANFKMVAAPFPLHNVRKDFEEGVQVTNNALHAGQLFISAGCSNLLGECSSLEWNLQGTNSKAGQPDHAADCLRYAAMEYWPPGTTKLYI